MEEVVWVGAAPGDDTADIWGMLALFALRGYAQSPVPENNQTPRPHRPILEKKTYKINIFR